MGRRGEARPTPGIPIAHPRASRARIVAVAVRKLTVFAWHFLTKGREYMRVCPKRRSSSALGPAGWIRRSGPNLQFAGRRLGACSDFVGGRAGRAVEGGRSAALHFAARRR